MEPISQTTVIGEHQDDYRPFFDNDWSGRIRRLAHGSKLARPVFDLCSSWKSSANAFMLPWLMVECLATQHNSFTGSNPPAARMADALTIYVNRQMGNKLPPDTLAELNSVMRSAALEMRDMGGRMKPPKMEPKDVWRELHGLGEFRLALLGVQRVVFPAIFFAYEDFLLRVFKIVARRNQFRLGSESVFISLLGRHLGETVVRDCWSHPDVQLARLVRHAIVHNGCRLTRELRDYPNHELVVEGEELQILPSYIRGLLGSLRDRAMRLTQIALKKLEAQHGNRNRPT